MDHVVYLDAKAAELENILSGRKTMIIRGAAGRKLPYGRVHAGDISISSTTMQKSRESQATVSSVHDSRRWMRRVQKSLSGRTRKPAAHRQAVPALGRQEIPRPYQRQGSC
jgi:hypothetical protein